MNNREIKLLTIAEEPSFKNCSCIVCRNHPVEIILSMGCHQTQLCRNCLNVLKKKIAEADEMLLEADGWITKGAQK